MTRLVLYRYSLFPRTTIGWNNLEQEIAAKHYKVSKHKSLAVPKTASAPPLSAHAISKIGSFE